jgi:hypothetical protein
MACEKRLHGNGEKPQLEENDNRLKSGNTRNNRYPLFPRELSQSHITPST